MFNYVKNSFSSLQGGLPSDLAQVYNAVASDMTPAVTTPTTIGLPSGEIDSTMAADDPWRRFIPSTPTASEVECHIDVKVVNIWEGDFKS